MVMDADQPHALRSGPSYIEEGLRKGISCGARIWCRYYLSFGVLADLTFLFHWYTAGRSGADRRLTGIAESINVKARNNTRSRSQVEYRGRDGGVGAGIFKFMWGIGLGLGAGMLLAPASGRQTRSSISERATELADNARSKYEQVRKSVTGATEDRRMETTGT